MRLKQKVSRRGIKLLTRIYWTLFLLACGECILLIGLFVYVTCPFKKLIYFFLIKKSSWALENTHTIHYKFCNTHTFKKSSILSSSNICYHRKTFGTRSALYTSYELFPTPIKKNLGSASSFSFLIPSIYVSLTIQKKK